MVKLSSIDCPFSYDRWKCLNDEEEEEEGEEAMSGDFFFYSVTSAFAVHPFSH